MRIIIKQYFIDLKKNYKAQDYHSVPTRRLFTRHCIGLNEILQVSGAMHMARLNFDHVIAIAIYTNHKT